MDSVDILKSLVKEERHCQVRFLKELLEAERKKSYLKLSYTSLFAFVIGELGLSESSAGKRIQVARCGERFPLVWSLLEQNAITLTTVSLLSPVLTEANHEELLTKARGKSRLEVEQLKVALQPRAETRDTIRLLPDTAAPTRLPQAKVAPPLPRPPSPKRDKVMPLSPSRVSLHFCADESLRKKVELAKALLSHKYPDGRLEDIFNEALDLLIEKATPQSKRTASRSESSVKHSRYIPRHVKATVYQRDGGRCAYLNRNGVRCGGTRFLTYDHIKPFALGGSSTDPGNLRLLCQNHNAFLAKQSFPMAHGGYVPSRSLLPSDRGDVPRFVS